MALLVALVVALGVAAPPAVAGGDAGCAAPGEDDVLRHCWPGEAVEEEEKGEGSVHLLQSRARRQRDVPGGSDGLAGSGASELHLDHSPHRARRLGWSRRGKARLPSDEGTYFTEAYGNGYSWCIGRVASDVLDFGGARSRAKLGLLTAGSDAIGDIWPSGGQTLTDGILGLAPGCFDHGCTKKTDAISSLVDGGALSAHVFTMCLHGGERSGGMLYLGPPEPDAPIMPRGTMRLPVEVGSGTYRLKALEPVQVFIGDVQALQTIGVDAWRRSQSVVDSGTGGLQVAEDFWEPVLREVWSKISGDAACHERWDNWDWHTFRRMANHYQGWLTAGMVACASPLIPDLRVQLGPETVLVVAGESLFHPLSLCPSAGFGLSWFSGQSAEWLFGTAFLRGKAVQFNAADMKNAYLLVGPSDGCEVDYSEGRAHSVHVAGSPGQLLSPSAGVITAEISLGTPAQIGFVVQLDTGSQDLLVYQSDCMMYGMDSCQGKTACQSCFLPVSGGDGGKEAWVVPFNPNSPTGVGGNFTPECKRYCAPVFAAAKATARLTRTKLTTGEESQTFGPVSLEWLSREIKASMQPYAVCAATRKACGDLHTFQIHASTTLQPGQLDDVPPKLAPPKFQAPVECSAACNVV